MNIFLSMALTNDMDRATPPHCLLVLASIIEQARHKVKIIFPIELDDFLNSPENLKDCHLIGLSVNSFNWHSTIPIIKKIHEYNPEITIVLGGCHPTALHKYCLEITSAQIVVRGEGEVTFPELINALKNKTPLYNIKGITYKGDGNKIYVNENRPLLSEKELSRLPIPSYHLIPANKYSYIPIESSRGCFFNCIFCAIPFPRPVRYASFARFKKILSTLNKLPEQLASHRIFLTDDSFSANKNHALGILELIRKSNPDFSIGCEVSINQMLKNNLISHFERSNFYLVQVGVECGYLLGLKKIKKSLKIEQVLEFAKRCSKTSFCHSILWSFIIGFPWEQEEQILETINFAYDCASLCKSQLPQVNNYAPYPNTELVNRFQEYDGRKINPNFYDSPNWFKFFLGETSISPENKKFFATYIDQRRAIYPNSPLAASIRLPSGKVLPNKNLI